jgi:hypothetical protein
MHMIENFKLSIYLMFLLVERTVISKQKLRLEVSKVQAQASALCGHQVNPNR